MVSIYMCEGHSPTARTPDTLLLIPLQTSSAQGGAYLQVVPYDDLSASSLCNMIQMQITELPFW